MFGPASLPYPDTYRPRPGSRRFVQHLGSWYAQAHPTEDFAETFAVWLKPNSAWRREYLGWPAFAKLEFIDELAAEIGDARPRVIDRSRIEESPRSRCTLRQHYERKLARYRMPRRSGADELLLKVFTAGAAHAARRSKAASVLRELRNPLRQQIVRSGAFSEYLVHQVLRLMIERCESLNLYTSRPASRAQTAPAVGDRPPGRVLRRAAAAAGRAVKKMRALVLVHATLVPPDSLHGPSEKEIDEWRTEYDVISHLKAAGHEVLPLGLSDSLSELRRAIIDWKPDIVFNLLEEFDGIVTYDQHVVAFLELMHQPYTGCNPRGMLLSRDKVLSKQLLSYHRVPTPQFMVFARRKNPLNPEAAAISDVRQVLDRGCLARHRARLGGGGRATAEGENRLHPRADAFGCTGRGIHRGPRALRRRDRQRPAEGAAGVGDDLWVAAGEAYPPSRRARSNGTAAISGSTASPPQRRRIFPMVPRRGSSSSPSASSARCISPAMHAWIFACGATARSYVLEANANPNLSAAEDFAQSALTAGHALSGGAASNPEARRQLPGGVERSRRLGRRLLARPAVHPGKHRLVPLNAVGRASTPSDSRRENRAARSACLAAAMP